MSVRIFSDITITDTKAKREILRGEIVVIEDGATVLGEGRGALTAVSNIPQYDVKLLNSGDVLGLRDGISFTSVANNAQSRFRLTNTEDGTIDGLRAVNVKGANTRITNDGLITADSVGVFSSATVGTAKFFNSGTIQADSHGIYSDLGQSVSLFNSGVIAGDSRGVHAEGDLELKNSGDILGNRGGFGVSLDSTADADIVNSGLISGTSFAIRLIQGKLMLENSGVTAGIIQGGDTGADNIRNTGTMTGDVNTRGGNDTVRNLGTIDGDVNLGAGNDTFKSLGTISGTVKGGSGNDTFVLRGSVVDIIGGTGIDVVKTNISVGRNQVDVETVQMLGFKDLRAATGASDNTVLGNSGDNRIITRGGDDTVFADDGNDLVRAGANADTVLGMDGNDTVFGGQGNDDLSGNDGDDRLLGGVGIDELNGNDGDDRLLGGAGIDELNGGKDQDTLIGGQGQDTLTGGSGADVFVFREVSDSDANPANADQIRDFVQGKDLIDLSAFLTDAVSIQNGGSLPDIGSIFGQMLVTVLNDTTTLELDLEGNGTIEFALRLDGAHNLSIDDFILSEAQLSIF